MFWYLLSVFAILAALYYWLIVLTEGVFLGRRIVIWLYDITAHRYDSIKQFDANAEAFFVIRPLLNRLTYTPAPFIVDVATGTGRVPLHLLDTPTFNGRVLGLDASAKMLAQAQTKLKPFGGRVQLVQQRADALPLPNQVCDAITCLEALEFFPSPYDALQEMSRVLRPGGTLLITRRQGWESRTFLHRYQKKADFRQQLQALGFINIEIQPWQIDYDLVFCIKPSKETN